MLSLEGLENLQLQSSNQISVYQLSGDTHTYEHLHGTKQRLLYNTNIALELLCIDEVLRYC